MHQHDRALIAAQHRPQHDHLAQSTGRGAEKSRNAVELPDPGEYLITEPGAEQHEHDHACKAHQPKVNVLQHLRREVGAKRQPQNNDPNPPHHLVHVQPHSAHGGHHGGEQRAQHPRQRRADLGKYGPTYSTDRYRAQNKPDLLPTFRRGGRRLYSLERRRRHNARLAHEINCSFNTRSSRSCSGSKSRVKDTLKSS